MSDSVGRIDLDLGINRQGFVREMNGISQTAETVVGGAFKKLGLIIAGAFAVKSMVDFGRASIELASNLNEVQNVVDVTFGSMSQQVNDFSKTALTSFGMSELSAKKYTSTMGAMLKSSGVTGQSLVNMSEGLTSLAGDMASFYNLSQDDAFQKIRAGIAGEVEPLRQLGVNMSVANMQAYALSKGIKGNYQDMTQSQQALLRYNYLLNATKDAQGDFARTSGSWANQTRLLSEQWKIFQGTMGQAFINMLTPVLRGINILISALQTAAAYFKAFTELVFGAQNVTSSTASATNDLSKATTGVGNSVKKAGKQVQNSLSAFDQLNVISQKAADGLDGIADGAAGVGGLDISPTSTTPQIDPTIFEPVKKALEDIKQLSSQVMTYLSLAFGPPIRDAIASVTPVINAWKSSLYDTFKDISKLGQPLKTWFTGDLVPFFQTEIRVIGNILAGLGSVSLAAFNGIRDTAIPVLSWFATTGLPLITDFATKAVIAFGEMAQGLFDSMFKVINDLNVTIVPLIGKFVIDTTILLASMGQGAVKIIQTMFDGIKVIFDTLWDGAISPGLALVSKILSDTLDIILGFWTTWGNNIVTGVQGAIDGVVSIFTTLWDSFLGPVVTDLLDQLSWLWDNHFKGLVQTVADFVGLLVTDALDIFNKFIVPVTNNLIKIFGPAFSTVFKLVTGILGTFIGLVVDVAKGVLKALGGIIDFITGVFTGDWRKAWNGISEIFGGVWDTIKGIAKGSVNFIIDCVNAIINAWNSIQFNLPDIPNPLGGSPLVKGATIGVPRIPNIPKLANGGLVSAPTLAMVGDNRGASQDPEVVTPLSKLQDMLGASNQMVVEVLLAILNALENMNPTLEIDGEKLTRWIRSNLVDENNRVGKKMVTVGGVPV